MKTKAALEQDIIDITMKIYHEFPELSKYIAEMPMQHSGTQKAGVGTKNLKAYYVSLSEVIDSYAKAHRHNEEKISPEILAFPGYPLYPASDDIYNRGIKEGDLNPEDLSKNKAPNEIYSSYNEKEFADDMTGGDLDIPGSELDDQQESVGSEDEENNYYSLGGEAHNDLEEDNG